MPETIRRGARGGGARRGIATLVVGMALTGLGACTSGDPIPGPGTSLTGASATSRTTATTTTSMAASTTTTAAPPTTAGPISPSEQAARPDSPAGATAFGYFVVSQMNAAYRIPDPRLYDTIVAPGCETCVRGRTSLEDLVKAGQRLETDMWSVTASRVLSWEPGSAIVELRIHQHRVAFVDSLGRKVDENVEKAYQYELTLTRIGETWKVSKWLNIQP